MKQYKGLLKARYCSEPMPLGVSHTGIAKLKENSYKKRYLGGNPNLYTVDPRGLLYKSPPKPPPDPKAKKKKKPTPDPSPAEEKTPRTYRLNKRLIRNRVLCYTDMMKRSKTWKNKKLFFWTVTFPDVLTEEQCYRIFQLWLTNLRSYYKILASYLWVAEYQKNGTIHFHVLIPHWMNVKLANSVMRSSLCTLSRRGETSLSIFKARKYNGVDIAKERKKDPATGNIIQGKAINFLEGKKVKTLAKYITKYITKNDTGMPRLAWNCSTDWSLPFFGVALTRGELTTLVTSREQINENVYETDFVMFWRWAHGPPESLMKHLSKVNSFMVQDYFESLGKEAIFFN